MMRPMPLTIMGSLQVAPPTCRDLASDPWTLIPGREALRASAHSLFTPLFLFALPSW
jgi:hypothetical protein